MGWLFQDRPIPTSEIIPHLKRRALTWDSDEAKGEMLDAAIVGNTVYAAVRSTTKVATPTRPAGHSYVFAAVILFRNNSKEGFGYKDMDEGMGPCEVDCPDRIMKLLSPFEDFPGGEGRYAVEWRESVKAHKAKKRDAAKAAAALKLKPGDRIETVRALSFGGMPFQRFQYRDTTGYKTRGMIFQPINEHGGVTGFNVRLTRDDLASAKLLDAAA